MKFESQGRSSDSKSPTSSPTSSTALGDALSSRPCSGCVSASSLTEKTRLKSGRNRFPVPALPPSVCMALDTSLIFVGLGFFICQG